MYRSKANSPARPRHRGLAPQRPSRSMLRNSCSTSTRPKTGSASEANRLSRSARSPSTKAGSAVDTAAKPTTRHGSRSQQRDLGRRGVAASGPQQDQQEPEPGRVAREVGGCQQPRGRGRRRQRHRRPGQAPERAGHDGDKKRARCAPGLRLQVARQHEPQCQCAVGQRGGDEAVQRQFQAFAVHGPNQTTSGPTGPPAMRRRTRRMSRQRAPLPVSTTATVSNRIMMSRNSVWFLT